MNYVNPEETAFKLREFEQELYHKFERGEIKGACHFSRGNELQLIDIFQKVKLREDWVFSTWRAHYHALLHGIPTNVVRDAVIEGRSINLNFPEYHFFASSIVTGCLPIATGVAYGIKATGGDLKVWCFVGDMAATTGAFHEAVYYSLGHKLPITFIIEDNGYSTNTPTDFPWGDVTHHMYMPTNVLRYKYEREWAHSGVNK